MKRSRIKLNSNFSFSVKIFIVSSYYYFLYHVYSSFNRCWTASRPSFLPSSFFSNPSNPLEINHSSESTLLPFPLKSLSIPRLLFRRKKKKKTNSLNRIEKASKWIVKYEIYHSEEWNFMWKNFFFVLHDWAGRRGGRNKKVLTKNWKRARKTREVRFLFFALHRAERNRATDRREWRQRIRRTAANFHQVFDRVCRSTGRDLSIDRSATGQSPFDE